MDVDVERLKMNDIDDLLARMRLLEIDHEPEGWPAVRTQDISALCTAVESVIPALDLLQKRFEDGCDIQQDKKSGRFYLFKDMDVITSGETLRAMILNLFLLDTAMDEK
mgnify:CR=1 FL=1